jgi:SAM-dependent methyltransferase
MIGYALLGRVVRKLRRMALGRGLRAAKTSRYWDETDTSLAAEYWMNIETVRNLVRERVTGSSQMTWFTRQVRTRETPFGRVLAFGDGYGMAAEAVQEKRDSTEVISFNISAEEGERFLAVMKQVGAQIPYRFVLGDANRFDFSRLGRFDTIIDVGAFHHFERLERILPALHEALAPDGRLYVDEYVGPSKYRFSSRVIELINARLAGLPESLVACRRKVSPGDFRDLWRRCPDPSEGIRSAELDRLLRRHFSVVQRTPYGGTLLQPFFLTSHLDPCRLRIANWHSTPDGRSAAAQLVRLELELMSAQTLGSDYCYYVLARRSAS